MTTPTRSRNIHPESFTFTVLIGALTALPSLATDMSLPALGGIARALHASPGEAALTLSLFLVGYALALIAFGPLFQTSTPPAPRGRSPAAPLRARRHPRHLRGARSRCCSGACFKGAGAGAGTVISFAVVRDLFDGAGLRRRLAQISIVRVIAPMVGPSLGAFVLPFGRLARHPPRSPHSSPHPPPRRRNPPGSPRAHPASPATCTRRCGSSRPTRASAQPRLPRLLAGQCLRLRLPLRLYQRLLSGDDRGARRLAANLRAPLRPGGYGAAGGILPQRPAQRRGIGRHAPLLAGLWLVPPPPLALLALSLAGTTRLPGLVSLLLLAAFGYGLITPNATQGALQPLPEVAGVAAAV